MEWNEWAPWYERIVSDLGLDPERDRKSARMLNGLLAEAGKGMEILDRHIRGRTIAIFGPAALRETEYRNIVKIAAGSAMGQLAERDIWPDIIVTDLDGDVPAQAEANARGAVAVIHAHGDNMETISRWVPEFTGPVLGTTQAEPFGNIRNFGGFTDGDRAVFLAVHFGARTITLEGFDFEKPVPKPGMDIAVKRMKLSYARELIEHARRLHDAKIVVRHTVQTKY